METKPRKTKIPKAEKYRFTEGQETPTEIKCPQCLEYKPFDCYAIKPKTMWGIDGICRDCRLAYNRQRYQ